MDKPKSRKKLFVFLFLAAGLCIFVYIYAPSFSDYYYIRRYGKTIPKLPIVQDFKATDRVVVFAPHPDDETLCCAGAIQKANAAGAQVFVVFMTSGDGFEWDDILLTRKMKPKPAAMIDLGKRRISESKTAAGILSVPRDHLFFLGYPDRGLTHLFFDHYKKPYTSFYTKTDKVPYAEALSPGALYTGNNLEKDLASILLEVKPTYIFMPAPMDAHPDHRATSFFVLRELNLVIGVDLNTYFWVVHGGLEWPLPKNWHTDLYLSPPGRDRSLGWERLDLTPAEVQTKKEAIISYKSQMRMLKRYMAAFARRNELFLSQMF
ncbi:MAG: PIG-L family deacetylase [bacterium]